MNPLSCREVHELAAELAEDGLTTELPDDGTRIRLLRANGDVAFHAAFNEPHILAITEAICRYRLGRGYTGPLFLARDTHALSEPATRTALQVLVAALVVGAGLLASLIATVGVLIPQRIVVKLIGAVCAIVTLLNPVLGVHKKAVPLVIGSSFTEVPSQITVSLIGDMVRLFTSDTVALVVVRQPLISRTVMV